MERSSLIKLLLLGIVCYRIYVLFPGFPALFAKSYDYQTFKMVYEGSQYMQAAGGLVPDEAIYSYAAGYYLYGGSPILVNPEHPPLGKYLLSLSIALFQNTFTFLYLFFLMTLLGFFLVAKQVLGDLNWSLAVLAIFLFDNMLINQLRYVPLLDIFHLCFIIFSFYFFMRWITEKKDRYIIVASLCLGFVASIKFFITAVVIVCSWILFLIMTKRAKKIPITLINIVLMTYVVLLLSYSRILVEQFDFLKVLRIQKWILWYQQSKIMSFFSIWPLIFVNRWQTWWGDYSIIKDDQWRVTWPLLFIGGFLTLFSFLRAERKETSLQILLYWFVAYSIFITFSQASSRYLIPILPFLYIITARGFMLWLTKLRKRKLKLPL